MKLTEILESEEIDRHELLARVYYPGNEEAAQTIFETERRIFREPLPKNLAIALSEAKAAQDSGNQERFNEMMEKALAHMDGYSSSALEAIDKDSRIADILIKELLDKNDRYSTLCALQIAETLGDQEQIRELLKLYISHGGAIDSTISYYQRIGASEEEIRTLRERELEERLNCGAVSALTYAREHFPDRVKEVALRIVKHERFTQLLRFSEFDENRRWDVYSALDEVPKELCEDYDKIRAKKSAELEEEICIYEKGKHWIDPDIFKALVGLDTWSNRNYRGIGTNEQLRRIYRKQVSLLDRDDIKPEARAEIAFEGYQRTNDRHLLEATMKGFIQAQDYEKVLECAKLLRDEKRIEMYGSIVEMMQQKATKENAQDNPKHS